MDMNGPHDMNRLGRADQNRAGCLSGGRSTPAGRRVEASTGGGEPRGPAKRCEGYSESRRDHQETRKNPQAI